MNMARKRPDDHTLDLFDWEPPPVAEVFDAFRIKSPCDRMRISQALSAACDESGMSRDDIHAAMCEYLGYSFSRGTFDRVMAVSAEGHEFTLSKFIAFFKTVQDPRVLNAILDGTEYVAIPRKFVGAVEEAMVTEQMERLAERRRLARRSWKGA